MNSNNRLAMWLFAFSGRLSLAVAIALIAGLQAAAPANAALVLHLPLNDGPAGGSVATAAAAINDAGHPTTSGTSSAAGDTWFNDPTRGIVYSSTQGNRIIAGTQGIDRAVGFTWSVWVKIDGTAVGNSDAGADVLIGTRQSVGGNWNKLQISSLENWAGITYGGSNLGNNVWRHIAYLGDTTSVRLYIDGALVGTDATTPTSTYNGNFEIGGTSTFTEDSEGLFSDVGVWNEGLTAGEVKGLFDVSKASPGLLYDVAEFDLLKQVHDAGSGSATVGSLTWSYASGLVGSAGLSGGGGNYTLILDATAGTGLTTLVVPEPSSLMMLAFGMISLWMFRKRN